MKKLNILLYVTSYIQWRIDVQWASYIPPEREYFFFQQEQGRVFKLSNLDHVLHW